MRYFIFIIHAEVPNNIEKNKAKMDADMASLDGALTGLCIRLSEFFLMFI